MHFSNRLKKLYKTDTAHRRYHRLMKKMSREYTNPNVSLEKAFWELGKQGVHPL